jgi:anti-anti-sigma factor
MSDLSESDCSIKMPRHFSGASAKQIVGSVNETIRGGVQKITFDFSESENIDSFGIGQLVALAKELKESHIPLSLSHLSDDMFQLFIDTGLDQIFSIEGVKQEIIDLFEVSVDTRLDIKFTEAGDVRIFNMGGIMDHVGGTRFFRQKLLLSLATHRKILLDLSELTFFDSLSVSTLLDMHKLLKETGGQMRICGANYLVDDLFTTLNLNAVIPLYRTQEEALAGWK